MIAKRLMTGSELQRGVCVRRGAILVCLLLAGCSGGSDLARVRGTVTLNGQPLEGATVQFQPVADDAAPSSGRTDSQGRYELMFTFDTRGAVPGEHLVSIRTAGTTFDGQGCDVETKERVPPEYNTRSTLIRVVEPGRNTFDFDL